MAVNFNATFTESSSMNASFTTSADAAASFGVTQIAGGVYPSDELPLMDGTADPGTSRYFSRSDHVHPSDNIKINRSDVLTNAEIFEIVNSIF